MRGHDRQGKHRTARANRRQVQVEVLESRCLLSSTNPFEIVSVNPANGSVVSSLPNSAPNLPVPVYGQITVTLSEPVAGLTDGQSPLKSSGTFNPYDVMLIPRGPSGVFSAPSGVNGGSMPLRVSVVYHVNSNGTSEFIISPAAGLANDVYGVSVNLAAFKDAAGNSLTDANNGFSTFLLRATYNYSNQSPFAVQLVTAFNGQTMIDDNVIAAPDTIQIEFNRFLYAGAAQGSNVQLVANPGPHFSVVPSVAVYNPMNASIYLTPTAALSPGTVYAVRVAGQDSGAGYVSDDQGYGGPGYPLAHTFYDTFEVSAAANIPAGPLRVAAIRPDPKLDRLSYVGIQLTEPLDVSSLGRYSAVLIPNGGTSSTDNFGAGTAPLNAVVAYNPNTLQLIIVPTQDFSADDYLLSLSGLKATNGNPLVNNAGKPAGVDGNPPYYALFTIA